MSRSSPPPDCCQQHGHGISVHGPSCVHFCDDDTTVGCPGVGEQCRSPKRVEKRDGEEDTVMDSTWLVICRRYTCGYPMGISFPFSCFEVPGVSTASPF